MAHQNNEANATLSTDHEPARLSVVDSLRRGVLAASGGAVFGKQLLRVGPFQGNRKLTAHSTNCSNMTHDNLPVMNAASALK